MGKIVKKEDFNKRTDLKSKLDQSFKRDFVPVRESSTVFSKEVLDSHDEARLIIEDARQDADQIREEARHMLEQAQQERESIFSDAERKGFEDGKQKVLEYLNQLYLLKDKLGEDIEPQLLKLSFAIAEKVVGKVLEQNDQALIQIVKQAISEIKGAKLIVRLHPLDYERVKLFEEVLLSKLDNDKSILFKEDEQVKEGGCIVESEIGTLDAQLDTQLNAIKKALGV